MVIAEILRDRLSLGKYLRELMRLTEMAIFAKDDPLPGILEVPLAGYTLFKARFRNKKDCPSIARILHGTRVLLD
jgi:predicted ATP-grasp superfamily ATP-dependent carboligase